MVTRELFRKLGIGITAVVMAATFINCTYDPSGEGPGPQPPPVLPPPPTDAKWCTRTTGAELYGFWLFDIVDLEPISDVVSIDPPIQLPEWYMCSCVSPEVDAEFVGLYEPGQSHGDDISVPDNEVSQAASETRDFLHYWLREVCHADALYYIEHHIPELLAEYVNDPNDLPSSVIQFLTKESVFTNCFGNELDYVDAGDIFQGAHPIHRSPNKCRYDAGKTAAVTPDAFNTNSLTPSLNRSSSDVEATYVLSRAEVANWTDRLSELMGRGIKLSWNPEANRFQVLNENRDRLLDKVGIEDGDLILAVNEQQVRSAADGWEAFAAAGNAPEILLEIRRNGARRIHKYVWEENQ